MWQPTTPVDGVVTSDPNAPTASLPTEALPGRHVYVPVSQVAAEPVYLDEEPNFWRDENRGAWIAGVVAALLVGGLIGLLIGRASASDDTPTAASPSTTVSRATIPQSAPPSIGVPASPADPAKTAQDLQAQVAALTAARDQSEQQLQQARQAVTVLQAALDQSKAQAGASTTAAGASTTTAGATTTTGQASQVAALQSQLTAATQQAATLQTQVSQATQAVAAAQAQLAALQASNKQLGLTPLDNFVGGDVGIAQQKASANGWTLVQQQTLSASAVPGTVTNQTPAAGSNMVKGSVLYVEVATKPPSATSTPSTT
jgi:hypothetical protein